MNWTQQPQVTHISCFLHNEIFFTETNIQMWPGCCFLPFLHLHIGRGQANATAQHSNGNVSARVRKNERERGKMSLRKKEKKNRHTQSIRPIKIVYFCFYLTCVLPDFSVSSELKNLNICWNVCAYFCERFSFGWLCDQPKIWLNLSCSRSLDYCAVYVNMR